MSPGARERWVGLAVIVITVLLTMMALAVLEDAEGNIAFDCVEPTERERVRDITLAGIDQGLQEATKHLYTIWQKDPNVEQPKRARVGIVNAVNAHSRARKFALDWSPPTCPSKEEK